MRYLHAVAIAIALWAPGPSIMFGQSSGLSIAANSTSYLLVSQTFVTRSQSYYTYQAIVVNNGPALASAAATATSLSPNITVVPGQGALAIRSRTVEHPNDKLQYVYDYDQQRRSVRWFSDQLVVQWPVCQCGIAADRPCS